METNEKSFFNALGPKRAFYVGLVLAFLSVGTIGFISLLAMGSVGSVAGASATKTADTKPTPTAAAAPTPTPNNGVIDIKPVSEDDHIRGDINKAKVTLVEFSDPECPFCKQFHPTMKQVVEDYDGEVAWVYRHFPLDSLHSQARKEAEATECAAELGGNDAFWAYIDRLFEVTPSNNGLDLAQLPKIAEKTGLNVSKFTNCLDSGKMAEVIADDLADAGASGGNGTPYSVVISKDGETLPVSGALPISTIKQTIDSLL